ncbi:tRNA preQ1(34) S-adenosylmethionine ribosyltransferase-isomerase QueA [Polynucleobacter sp. IMCC 29146]|uniref:tRNA preQ1(34) S-adenosylmethionine ribosyltransferase-isomerase QueA n=1 Tax=Polynucleobacter sp. IMCC 29146 TaxID=2780953 RepID=UPI001F021DEA|nr:tRNA preQ1(34) S-adenosylmethionine ribosyltransferase-isomerase QueA [Polynucleobacter sp. IMCC 29146]MCE7530290.1 tRNA preQ1(34) S-adenosylmethionine ribosyltransferase-isomerase QueA [Polynucleobacter sp. IMCC 29146]
MHLADFNYDLPPELIAQFPLAERSDSRLLEVITAPDGQTRLLDRQFRDLIALIEPGDLLILNDTRVIPARIYGHKSSGGKIELLIERITGENTALVQIRASKNPPVNSRLILHPLLDGPASQTIEVVVSAHAAPFYEIQFPANVFHLLPQFGEPPLPPYITHRPDKIDVERYQTVVAKNPGAVAAPTAGLHFDETLLKRCREKGVQINTLTLHVGAGTFSPVRQENLAQHVMHAEYYSISPEIITQIKHTHAQGKRVIAVGTTTLRALETYALNGAISGETKLFITPGFNFALVDTLITNFHLPKSTLLMLVSAFAGLNPIQAAYQHAIAQRYRFFSYGDAMLLHRQAHPPL